MPGAHFELLCIYPFFGQTLLVDALYYCESNNHHLCAALVHVSVDCEASFSLETL